MTVEKPTNSNSCPVPTVRGWGGWQLYETTFGLTCQEQNDIHV